jgi:hypothetical protein
VLLMMMGSAAIVAWTVYTVSGEAEVPTVH